MSDIDRWEEEKYRLHNLNHKKILKECGVKYTEFDKYKEVMIPRNCTRKTFSSLVYVEYNPEVHGQPGEAFHVDCLEDGELEILQLHDTCRLHHRDWLFRQSVEQNLAAHPTGEGEEDWKWAGYATCPRCHQYFNEPYFFHFFQTQTGLDKFMCEWCYRDHRENRTISYDAANDAGSINPRMPPGLINPIRRFLDFAPEMRMYGKRITAKDEARLNEALERLKVSRIAWEYDEVSARCMQRDKTRELVTGWHYQNKCPSCELELHPDTAWVINWRPGEDSATCKRCWANGARVSFLDNLLPHFVASDLEWRGRREDG